MSLPQPNTTAEHGNPGPSYRKRSDAGAQSASGTTYEMLLQSVVALLAFSCDVSGEQTYEEDKNGCLDDLCFKYRDSRADGRMLNFIQAKHSTSEKKIEKNDLTAPSGKRDTFSLAKYFMAFLEAKKTATNHGDRLQRVVLFTNRGVSENLLQHLVRQTIEDIATPMKELLDFPGFDEASFYKIQDAFDCDLLAVASCPKEEKIKKYRDDLIQWWEEEQKVQLDCLKKEFLQCLTIAANQPNVKNLQEIQNNVFASLQFCQTIGREEKVHMLDYFGKSLKLWMHDTSPTVSSWTSEMTINCLKEAKAQLSSVKIQGLSDANFRRMGSGVRIPVMSPRFPDDVHIFETHQLTLYARLATEEASQSDRRLLWADEITEDLYDGLAVMKDATVVIVHDVKRSSVNVNDILQRILNFDRLKTIILTNQPGVGQLLDVIGASHIIGPLYELMQESVEFQGHDLKLQDIVVNRHGLLNLLEPTTIEQLSSGERIVVGKIIPSPKEPYTVRHLDLIKESAMERDSGEMTQTVCLTLAEEEIITEAIKRKKNVIVSASPGSGKSMLASSMCSRIKVKEPTWWVGRCDLKEKMTVLGKHKEEKNKPRQNKSSTGLTESEYGLLWNLFDVKDVERKLIKHRFSGSGRVVFIIDSYDEIEHLYGSEFRRFLQTLTKIETLCICIMTGEHLLQEAKSVLQENLAFGLNLLTHDEQIELLSKIMSQRSGKTHPHENDPENIIRKLPAHFTSNPLHLYMASETEAISDVANENNESLYSMYRKFVQIKFDRYWGESKYDPKTDAEGNNRIMENDHKQIAIWHLLGESHKWNSREERTELLKRVQERNIGFVSEFEQGHPRFVHESYAEYFLSLHVYEASNQLENCQEMSEFMTLRRFSQVRSFLDGILELAQEPRKIVTSTPPDTTELRQDFLFNSVRERLVTLSLHLWHHRNCFPEITHHMMFVEAVQNCLPPVVKQAIHDKIDVNQPDLSGTRALDHGMHGTEAQQLSILQILFSAGYKIRATCEATRPSTLHGICLRNIFPAVVKELIEKGCDVNAATPTGETVLHKVAISGDINLVRLLVEYGCRVNAETQSGETVLHRAVWSGNVNVLGLLIENGCDVNAVTKEGETVLHRAVWTGHLRVVQLLIQKKCNVAVATPSGETVLHRAVWGGNKEVLAILIENGCDVNARTNSGETALHQAARSGNIQIVELLFAKRCNVYDRTNSGETALHHAARSGNIDIVQLLIEKGCPVNARTNSGETALHQAARSGNIQIVQLLIEKGCHEIDAMTALYLAARDGNIEMVLLLLEKGCHVHGASRSDMTALHLAAISGNIEMVQYYSLHTCW